VTSKFRLHFGVSQVLRESCLGNKHGVIPVWVSPEASRLDEITVQFARGVGCALGYTPAHSRRSRNLRWPPTFWLKRCENQSDTAGALD
jgi:hypothetical protein